MSGLFSFEKILDVLLSVIPALICITIHELSHGLAALKLGDPTARERGRLTLNPIKHIDIWGLLMLSVFGFGWAKPVPVNPSYFKKPKRDMALTALAGPVSNLVLAVIFAVLTAIVAAIPVRNYEVQTFIFRIMTRVITLSVGLAVFNMIPIPPLDGSKILFSLLPDNAYRKLLQLERFGFIILIIILQTPLLDGTIGAATQWITGGMIRIFTRTLELITKIFIR